MLLFFFALEWQHEIGSTTIDSQSNEKVSLLTSQNTALKKLTRPAVLARHHDILDQEVTYMRIWVTMAVWLV